MALGFDGEKLIKGYERRLTSSFTNPKPHLTSYRDSGGVLTIGWGHTGPDVVENQTITQAQADAQFLIDVTEKAEAFVNRYITIRLSQKQRDALISFTYNAGGGSLQKSELRKLVNQGNHIEAANVWLSQNIKDRSGTTQLGLIARRKQESQLYLEGTTQNQLSAESDELEEPLEEKKIDNKEHIVPYTHSRGLEQMTIEELLQSNQFVTTDLDKKEVLDLEFRSKTNHRRLYDSLSIKDRRFYDGGDGDYNNKADYPIVSGTTIYLSSEKIAVNLTYQSNITTQNVVFNEYWPEKIKAITNDPGYIPAFQANGDAHRSIHPQITVFIWSRALYLQQGNVGGFINITRHIERATIEGSMQIGGNFTLTMSPVIGELTVDDERDLWEQSGDLGTVDLGNINKKSSIDSERSEFIRSHSYYEKIIQQNDLVFISFEKLEIEEDDSISDVIQNKWIDMIGLVDTSDVITDATSTEMSTTIRGRDLIKALMDDNSYFNPYSIGHVNSLYGGKLGDRYLQGEFQNLAAYLAVSLKDKVEFIIHRIASIGYVPDDILDSFDDKTKITTVKENVNTGNSLLDKKDAKGIWQICKVFIDPSITNLKLADDSVSNPQGSILDLFNKIAQYPFVEFFSDTYRDKFYIFFRQPPFTQKALSEISVGYDPKESSPKEKGRDRKKEKRVDSAPTSSEETLMIDNDKSSKATDSKFPIVVNISAVDTLSDNLRFSNESYAWYQIEQKGNFAGTTVSLGHVPALYFDEYAQVFGNKRLNVVSNYSDYKFFEFKEGKSEQDLYADQAAQQLAFAIETTIYLPFTRQGTITMNGDRRIKKGNWIFYRPTQEFFYVTSVTNQISISKEAIDRTTTIQVERGMVGKYVNGTTERIDGEDVKISYFDLVNIPKLKDGVYDTITKGSASDKFDYKSDIAINDKVFKFFLKRRQFN